MGWAMDYLILPPRCALPRETLVPSGLTIGASRFIPKLQIITGHQTTTDRQCRRRWMSEER